MAVLGDNNGDGSSKSGKRGKKLSSKNETKKSVIMDLSDAFYKSHLLLKVCGFWPGKWRVVFFSCWCWFKFDHFFFFFFVERIQTKCSFSHDLHVNIDYHRFLFDL